MGNKPITLTITAEFMGAPQTVHPVLVQGMGGWLLVDCGYVGSLSLLEQALKAHGTSAGDTPTSSSPTMTTTTWAQQPPLKRRTRG